MATKPLGPGPGAYRLPTTVGYSGHDPSRARAPQYSLGLGAPARRRAAGPGPAYRVERVTREGLMFAPAWSFGARFPTRGTLRTPGPGAHAPERCAGGGAARAPAYSLGARPPAPARRAGPAPNAYALRSGPAPPAWSMGARMGWQPKAKSPGPAVYFQKDQNLYRARPPVYSLGARLDGAGKPSKSPGPAAYPPRLYNTKKNPYAYSFGRQHALWAPPMIVKEDTMDCL